MCVYVYLVGTFRALSMGLHGMENLKKKKTKKISQNCY